MHGTRTNSFPQSSLRTGNKLLLSPLVVTLTVTTSITLSVTLTVTLVITYAVTLFLTLLSIPLLSLHAPAYNN